MEHVDDEHATGVRQASEEHATGVLTLYCKVVEWGLIVNQSISSLSLQCTQAHPHCLASTKQNRVKLNLLHSIIGFKDLQQY